MFYSELYLHPTGNAVNPQVAFEDHPTDQVNFISILDWMKLSISSFPDEPHGQKRVDFMALVFSFGAVRDQLKVKNRLFLLPPCPRRFSGSKTFPASNNELTEFQIHSKMNHST